jgi:hypothetical protein
VDKTHRIQARLCLVICHDLWQDSLIGKERMSQPVGGNKMRSNNPLISSAKVRGLIKKNGIRYVDSTEALYGWRSAAGVNVWQLCDTIYLRPYGNDEQQAALVAKLNEALLPFGLVIVKVSSSTSMHIEAVA